MSENIVVLPMEKVLPPDSAIREFINPEAVRELAESIREQGLLQPVLVVPRGEKYEIVAGHRRYLAHRLIGKTEINSVVRELTDEEVLIIRATENVQREDLSPMEEARVYGVLRSKLGYTMEDIARKMGKNRMTIKKYLTLLDLPDDMQDLVGKKILSMEVAIVLKEIDDDDLRRYYVVTAVDNGISSKTAKLWVEDWTLSKMGQYYGEDRGKVEETYKLSPAPIYVTCFLCHGASEVMDTSTIQVCKTCYNNVILTRKKRISMGGGD